MCDELPSFFALFVLHGPFQWSHNGNDGVSNHQPHQCLLNCLFGRRSKKTSKLHVTGLCVGNSPGPGNSQHKWPVTRKMFPFDDVNMLLNLSAHQITAWISPMVRFRVYTLPTLMEGLISIAVMTFICKVWCTHNYLQHEVWHRYVAQNWSFHIKNSYPSERAKKRPVCALLKIVEI